MQYVLLILVLAVKFNLFQILHSNTLFKFYVVTRSYSSRPFLWALAKCMAGGVCAHHSVIILCLAFHSLQWEKKSRKFQFYELYMIIVNLGDSTGLSIVVHVSTESSTDMYHNTESSTVVHVSTHFHNSHVLHTPSLYFLYYTKSPNAYFVYSCMLVIISSKPKLSNNSLIIIVGKYHC